MKEGNKSVVGKTNQHDATCLPAAARFMFTLKESEAGCKNVSTIIKKEHALNKPTSYDIYSP